MRYESAWVARPFETVEEQPYDRRHFAVACAGSGSVEMISLSHLRTQLEQSFSPLACECTLTGDHSLTVKLYHPDSGQVDLVISGLKVASLGSPESVQALIEELRYELQSNSLPRSNPVV